MAYDKKYIGEKEAIKPYLDDREDKIGSAINEIVDYPTNLETGYERYKSGKVVQYGQVEVNWETSKPLGSAGLFYGSDVQINFPRQFGLIPEVYFELVVGNTVAWTQLRNVTSTSFYFIVISPFQYNSTRKDKVYWRAIGR